MCEVGGYLKAYYFLITRGVPVNVARRVLLEPEKRRHSHITDAVDILTKK